MKILVIGSGGREHAITWALRNTSSTQPELFCAPGNAGISEVAQLLPIPVNDQNSLIEIAKAQKIDLTFVGPEAPLTAGIVDDFQAEGLPIVGPDRAASRLEGSKVFAKNFMVEHGIPTARYRVADSPQEAISVIRKGEFGSKDSPLVVKADGLAAGKGVIVAESALAAEKAVEDLMIHHIAGRKAAASVVLEEALVGQEVSVLAFVDGRDYALMPVARDHKRVGEHDTGPNTGGMGSITDDSLLDQPTVKRIVKEFVEPTLEGSEKAGFRFKGVLFLGLMLTAEGPKLLEYNVRFGDPETQAILVRLKTDLTSIFEAIRGETLGRLKVEWLPGASACVVAVNKGYPGKYESGGKIEGLQEARKQQIQVFHAGTSRSADGHYLATGGRVLGVTALGASLPEALQLCYSWLEKIRWPGMQFRRDIGRLAGGMTPS